MRWLVDRAEGLLISAFLLIFLGIFWPPDAYFGTIDALANGSDPYHAGVFVALAAFLAAGCLFRRERMLRLLLWAWPVLVLVGLAFVSTFWSEDKTVTWRHTGTLAETTIFAVYLLARYEMGELVALLVKVFALAALASLAIMVLSPNLAMGHNLSHLDSWRGAFTDKNDLGIFSAMAILIGSAAFWYRDGWRWVSAGLAVAGLVLLHLADSKTPVVGLIVAFYVTMIAATLRWRTGAGLAAGYLLVVAGLAIAAFIAFHFDTVMGLLNRSASLTSRTPIWELTLRFFERRPWLGYGYFGFWREGSDAVQQVQALLQWPVPTAHNAWIEMGLAMGWVGIIAQAGVWLVAVYRVARALWLPAARHVLLGAAIFGVIQVSMITESTFLTSGNMLWVLFVVCTIYPVQETVRHRETRRNERAGAGTLVASPATVLALSTARPTRAG